MKQKNQISTNQEFDILREQLDERDIYVISYLKGFNRNDLKKLASEGLFNLYQNE